MPGSRPGLAKPSEGVGSGSFRVAPPGRPGMDDTTAVVTGAGGGIGRAVAAAFADAGAHVVGCGRPGSDVEAALADLDGVEAFPADVRDEFDVERLAEHAARAGPATGIDAVVPCAAVVHGEPGGMPLQDEPYSRFDDTMRTNARGVFATVREAAPHLTDRARVLVPSGGVVREADPGMGAYAVSKAAAEALARGFAADLAQPVGVVDPGPVATDLAGGEGRDPEHVAGMFVWAARDVAPERLDGAVLDLKTWVKETRSQERESNRRT